MTFRASSKNRGIILIDILLALTLGGVFAAIIAESSSRAHQIFFRAYARELALEEYEKGRYAINSGLYGNDRIESFMNVGTSTSEIQFRSVARAQSEPLGARGTSLCAVRFATSTDVLPHITQILLPVNPLLPLTDIAVRNGIAYVTADSAIAADPDLLIFDLHDPASPKVLSSINTGPGLNAISLAGNRVFAAAASTAAELHVIRLDGLDRPFLESKYRLPLPVSSSTPPLGSAVFFDNRIMYVGTEKWDGDEFASIDVSNPGMPTKMGGFETGSKVNAIYVHNGYAFVALAGQNQLLTLDIHDPAHPTVAGSFSPSGWQRQEGKVVHEFENSLNFGRTSGGYNIASDHEAFLWSESTPGFGNTPTSIDVPGGVYGIAADRDHIFLATRQVNKEFQIWNKDFAATSSQSFSLPVAPQALTCDGETIYVLAHSSNAIYEIKV